MSFVHQSFMESSFLRHHDDDGRKAAGLEQLIIMSCEETTLESNAEENPNHTSAYSYSSSLSIAR